MFSENSHAHFKDKEKDYLQPLFFVFCQKNHLLAKLVNDETTCELFQCQYFLVV